MRTVLKGSLNILHYGCLFNYYKVSTCHKIHDQPTQLELINEATFTLRLSIPSACLHLQQQCTKLQNSIITIPQSTPTDTLQTPTPQTHKVLHSAEVIRNRLPLVETNPVPVASPLSFGLKVYNKQRQVPASSNLDSHPVSSSALRCSNKHIQGS